ncbi:sensor histidine kinase [Entomobacter blattae]|uniref:histidine kinase n=1 Tax=Entomobacter blattae TaxID=2762277 RepID=A0A7H1NNW4_9PROT|nr:ATP-binding protein [Entomobacter blattae]QNT77474.1 Phosphate regulon sensor protein PhoR [Entomobacter blattae]
MVFFVTFIAISSLIGWGITIFAYHSNQKKQRLTALYKQKESKEHLQQYIYEVLLQMVETLPHNLILMNKEGALLYTNSHAKQSLDYDLHTLLRHPQFFLHRDRILIRKSSSFHITLTIGSIRHFHVTMQATTLAHYPDTLILIGITNQSHQHTLEQTQNDFIANASHELRTPLTALKGLMETILGPAKKDEQAKSAFLQVINEKIHYMINLTDNLLYLSQLQSSFTPVPKKPTHLTDITRKIVDDMRLSFPHINFELQHPAAFPPITANTTLIEQMIRNIMENAVRYAGKGQISQGHITLSLQEVREGKKQKWPDNHGMLLQIEDNGPGILPQHIPKLTERFYRADLHSPGSGIGLAIVQHIVNSHNGQIKIESQLNKGSRFSIWLPLER